MFLPTLKRVKSRNKSKYFDTPKKVQGTIAITAIYDDGIFEHEHNMFSVCFRFTDVNYAVLGENEKSRIFDSYCDIIKSFPPGMAFKITVNNRKINVADLREKICVPMNSEDGLDGYRAEYNQTLAQQITNKNNLVQEKYITVSSEFENVDDARRAFSNVANDLSLKLNTIKSSCIQLDVNERLRILHDFYRDGEHSDFSFNLRDTEKMGHSYKDYICPDFMDYSDPSFIRLSHNKFVRCLFLKDYSKSIYDDVVTELTKLDKEMMLSVDTFMVPINEAIDFTGSQLLGQETNITRWQGRQNRHWNFSASVPLPLQQTQKACREYMEDLTEYDQRMMQTVVTIVIAASTKEELERETEEICSRAVKNAQVAVAYWEQIEGLNTALPIGVCKMDDYRTMLTESVAIFMPFRVQDVVHENGTYYGQNAESGSLIMINKPTLQNGNAFVFGVPGSGKSFIVKMELIGHVLRGDCDVIIVDPQGEYGKLVTALNGEVIKFSPSSTSSINLMDINEEYREEGGTPVALKSDFLISFAMQACEGMMLTPIHRSIIVRCTENVYSEYVAAGYRGKMPTLFDLLKELRAQPEPEGQELALAMEMFTSNSFSMFAQETNVDTQNSLLCYDIRGLGTTLQSVGMLTMLDAIFNRITLNSKKGRNTYVYFDEFHLLVKDDYSTSYLDKLFRTIRKFGAFATGITQNVEAILRNETVRSMVSNSEVITMLNQAEQDRRVLASLLKFSPELLRFVTNAPEGHGLIRISETVVPFANNFPKNTELYDLMNTKFSEIQKGKNDYAG